MHDLYTVQFPSPLKAVPTYPTHMATFLFLKGVELESELGLSSEGSGLLLSTASTRGPEDAAAVAPPCRALMPGTTEHALRWSATEWETASFASLDKTEHTILDVMLLLLLRSDELPDKMRTTPDKLVWVVTTRSYLTVQLQGPIIGENNGLDNIIIDRNFGHMLLDTNNCTGWAGSKRNLHMFTAESTTLKKQMYLFELHSLQHAKHKTCSSGSQKNRGNLYVGINKSDPWKHTGNTANDTIMWTPAQTLNPKPQTLNPHKVGGNVLLVKLHSLHTTADWIWSNPISESFLNYSTVKE